MIEAGRFCKSVQRREKLATGVGAASKKGLESIGLMS